MNTESGRGSREMYRYSATFVWNVRRGTLTRCGFRFHSFFRISADINGKGTSVDLRRV